MGKHDKSKPIKKATVNLAKLVRTDHKGSTLLKMHKYSTRFKTEPNLPATKSSKYHNSFLHQSIKVFSTLPTHMKNTTNLKAFVRAIKHLSSHILSYTITSLGGHSNNLSLLSYNNSHKQHKFVIIKLYRFDIIKLYRHQHYQVIPT